MLWMTTSAPGTTAPFESLTVPRSVPVTVCAAATAGRRRTRTNALNKILRLVFGLHIILLCRGGPPWPPLRIKRGGHGVPPLQEILGHEERHRGVLKSFDRSPAQVRRSRSRN